MELAGECPARRGRKEDEGQNGCTSSRERYWREESTRELTTVVNRADDDGEIRGRVVLCEGCGAGQKAGMAGGSSGWRARACGEEDCERNGLSSLTSGGEQIARRIASQGEW